MMSARILTAGLRRKIAFRRPPANLNIRSLLPRIKYLPSTRSSSTNAARILTFRANSGENNAENNLFSINAILGATAATCLIAGSQFGDKSRTECCGIAAVIGKPTETSDAR